MARPRNSDIRMWWHTPWDELTTNRKAQAVKLYRREHGDYDAVATGVLLDTSPELTLIEAIRLIAEQDATDHDKPAETVQQETQQQATAEATPIALADIPEETTCEPVSETAAVQTIRPVDLPVGTVAASLPASIRVQEESPSVRHARIALEHPGEYVLHRVMLAKDGADHKRARTYASSIRSGQSKAFGPRGRFDAKAIEVAEGVWQIWIWALGVTDTELSS